MQIYFNINLKIDISSGCTCISPTIATAFVAVAAVLVTSLNLILTYKKIPNLTLVGNITVIATIVVAAETTTETGTTPARQSFKNVFRHQKNKLLYIIQNHKNIFTKSFFLKKSVLLYTLCQLVRMLFFWFESNILSF